MTRRLDPAGNASDAPLALQQADAALVRDCMTSGRPTGRFTGEGYRAAAPVARADGRSAGAVLVTISTLSSRNVLWWQAAGAAVSALFVGLPAVLAAVWLARSIAEPVGRALAVAEAIAAGDLTQRVPPGGAHEMGRLLGSFQRMTQSLGGLIGRIQSAGERLSRPMPRRLSAGRSGPSAASAGLPTTSPRRSPRFRPPANNSSTRPTV